MTKYLPAVTSAAMASLLVVAYADLGSDHLLGVAVFFGLMTFVWLAVAREL